MATVAGKIAEVTMANYDTYAHNWTIDFVTDALEDTNWDGSGYGQANEYWRTYLAGLSGWSGSFECYASGTPATSILPGTSATAKFYVDIENTYGYTGTILITGVHPTAPIDGIQSYTVDYQGSGKPTVGDIS